MTSFIAAGGLGRSTSFIPAVPAAWSVTTIAFMEIVSSAIYLCAGYVPAIKAHSISHARGHVPSCSFTSGAIAEAGLGPSLLWGRGWGPRGGARPRLAL